MSQCGSEMAVQTLIQTLILYHCVCKDYNGIHCHRLQSLKTVLGYQYLATPTLTLSVLLGAQDSIHLS